MEQTMIKNEKLVEAVKNIPAIADRDRWVFTLDTEEGTLFYSPKKIPDDAELHQITDEYALYTDKNYNPLGVMVEYYNVNFVKHHGVFAKLSSRLFSGGGKIKVVGTESTKGKEHENTLLFKALLERILIKEADTKLIPA